MRLTLYVALFLVALRPCAAVSATITIDTVPIGNPGNAKDPLHGNAYGAVSYVYNIGKFEVTVGQYTAFLNAVAAADTFGLYDSNMATNLNVAGIAQSGSSGSYTYSVIDSPNHPVTYVNWGDAARFCNWLHNGQPTGAEGPGTTETGAYTLNGATTMSALLAINRNAGAVWFIPSENEWYKAAYYQPVGQTGLYNRYPMRTNAEPYSDQPPGATPDNTRVGNFYRSDGTASGFNYNNGYAVTGSTVLDSNQNYLTDVGAYTSTTSSYGTFDQAGNAYEWTETLFTPNRIMRGGAWNLGQGSAQADDREWMQPQDTNSRMGFRVAAIVPEPSTAALIGLAAVALFNVRRRIARPTL